jgi:aldehyde dehydrogenase (NAD+)
VDSTGRPLRGPIGTPVSESPVNDLVRRQRDYFLSGATRPVSFRTEQLRVLEGLLRRGESALTRAMWEDMRRPPAEAFLGELNIAIAEVRYALRHLQSWVEPRSVATPLVHLPGRSTVHPEPRGLALIISAWNYPIQQLFSPLVGSIAAGGCAILKPSEDSPSTAECIADLIHGAFPEEYVAVVIGGRDLTHEVIRAQMDAIFFTGSPPVGRLIMEAASAHLTPVTLELGGKSPCIVDPDADVAVAARRIAWGKFFNAGQTCVAPDYAYVHRSVFSVTVEGLKASIRDFYGDDVESSPDYARIINDRAFDRVERYLGQGQILFGGTRNKATRFIGPTLITEAPSDSPVMQEEIFGPVLPLIPYEDLDQVIDDINRKPKPLALYLFSANPAVQEEVVRRTSSGGVTINDTMVHGATTTLPFGGVGNSGFGAYHGKATFDVFTHYKSVMTRALHPDVPIRYPPYGELLNRLKRVLRLLG